MASDGEHLQPGHVYLAPDARQLRVTRARVIALDTAAPENGLQPAVSYLFRSLADVRNLWDAAAMSRGERPEAQP